MKGIRLPSSTTGFIERREETLGRAEERQLTVTVSLQLPNASYKGAERDLWEALVPVIDRIGKEAVNPKGGKRNLIFRNFSFDPENNPSSVLKKGLVVG